jgi:hypothetical protein
MCIRVLRASVVQPFLTANCHNSSPDHPAQFPVIQDRGRAHAASLWIASAKRPRNDAFMIFAYLCSSVFICVK